MAGKADKPHYHGHRQRLRERFLKGGPDSLPDYELLELILFGALRQGDVKPLAKRLIEQFDGLAGVLSAEVEALQGAGHEVLVTDPFDSIMGHAGALVVHPTGVIEAASDPRSDGTEASY